jgi:hypothetical protein
MLLMPVLLFCVPAIGVRFSVSVRPPPGGAGTGTLGASQATIEVARDSDRTASADPMSVRAVTVGVLVPTILLPVVWRRWSREKLRAVLAHEVAHIQRRDLLVAFIAHLNRCLLWFHPLSWWLERTLASTAEQASDDIALSVVGTRAAYAEILLDMAREVSQGRGRMSWLGVGIDGSGSLNQRINRVLSAEVVREMSTVRTAVLARLEGRSNDEGKFGRTAPPPAYAPATGHPGHRDRSGVVGLAEFGERPV